MATLASIARGQAAFEAQDEAKSSHAPLLKKSDGVADFSKPAAEILNRFRAFKARPGFYTALGTETLKILEMRLSEAPLQPGGEPGLLTSLGPAGIELRCGDGNAVWVSQVQGQGGKPMPAADYARGHHVKAGMRMQAPQF